MKQHHRTRRADALSLSEAATLLRVSRRTTAVALLMRQLPRRRHGWRLVVPTRELMTSFGVPLDPDGDSE